MKNQHKLIGLICLIYLSISGSQAQKVYISPKGGLTLGTQKVEQSDNFSSVEPSEYKHLIRYNFGLGVEYVFKENNPFSIQAEVLYVQKGLKEEGFYLTRDIRLENESYFNFIEVPLLFKTTYRKGSIQPFAVLGTNLSFLLNGKYKYTRFFSESQPQYPDVTREGDIEINSGSVPESGPTILKQIEFYENVNKIQLGLQVGGGVQINTGFGALLLESRYEMDLTKFAEPHYLLGNQEKKNRLWFFNIGYLIPIN